MDWAMSAEAAPVAAVTANAAREVAVRQAMKGRIKVLRDAAGNGDGILYYHNDLISGSSSEKAGRRRKSGQAAGLFPCRIRCASTLTR
ncbi:hypothetical protein GCM10022254_05560 [Actinomadura meridiana]|uniref:Uncharacterized protein n=1 Tax=Actinomadura meridiana TaxID=559626 RepID=A0ABP8BTD7_9ACTN